jgi:hypothetical protein
MRAYLEARLTVVMALAVPLPLLLVSSTASCEATAYVPFSTSYESPPSTAAACCFVHA